MKKFITFASFLLLTACASINTYNTYTQNSEENINSEASNLRIVSLSPSTTETLIFLGLHDNIIAVDQHSSSFIDNGIPEFNLFAGLDIEQLMVLNPDIIFTAFWTLEEHPFEDILVIIPPVNYLAEIETQLMKIASKTNTEELAIKLAEEMNERVENLLFILEQFDLPERSVYFEIGAEPAIFTVGQGTFINEIIELVGARNIFYDTQGWIPAIEEEVVYRNPEVILTNVAYLEDPISEIFNRTGWEVIEAIQIGQVHYINSHWSSSSNILTVNAIEEIALAIFPEIFLKFFG
ncbi:MAG: ABC transporter substrate-binding protein [Defluviitaleaceae bacterium]|nr:ABC transporter substrate-binding protein [Defluviitaleaceae bacterium]